MNRNVKIDVSRTVAIPNPRMWGIFYEEINHAGDGGLYAEQIRNRNFAESNLPEGTVYADSAVQTKTGHREVFSPEPPLPGWKLTRGRDRAIIDKTTDNPRNNACPEQLRLTSAGAGTVKLQNSGYWGFASCAEGYHGFIIARGEGIGWVTVGFERTNGVCLTSVTLTDITAEFKKLEFTLGGINASDARFFIETGGAGALYLDFVSLFPNNTYKSRKYGLRDDLAVMLEKLKPGFVRFPGGCVVEGINLRNAIHWKKTIGPIEDRPGHWDLWGYRCTDGLGMHEFLQLCEDLSADAMYVCNCGMSCQARSMEAVWGNDLESWLADALDAIEYAVGDVSTVWGGERAKNGHPEPFPLRYVEIGNENSGEVYAERYKLFYGAIKAKYPALTLIANTPVQGAAIDMLDDHYYTRPQTMPQIYDKYENFPSSPEIYVGEYACNTDVGYGNLLSAISEACFMVGMERSADAVRIASYAPLFCNVNDRKWPVNLINFDNNRAFAIPSYYIQKLFSEYTPQRVVSAVCDRTYGLSDLYVSAGIKDGCLIIKAVCFGAEDVIADIEISGAVPTGKGTVIIIGGESEAATNSLLYPEDITPSTEELSFNGGIFSRCFKACSFSLIKLEI